MIHEIGVEVNEILAARGCPLRVVDGPEPTTTTTWGRERIVIEHIPGADQSAAVRSQHLNPKQRMIVLTAVKLTIYARSPSAGALEWEHIRRVEQARDMVIVALAEVLAVRKNGWSFKSMGLTTPADLSKSETQAGAVYEMTVMIERGVEARTWVGEAQPEGTLAGITSTTKVSLTNGENDPTAPPAGAATACGN